MPAKEAGIWEPAPVKIEALYAAGGAAIKKKKAPDPMGAGIRL